MASKSDLEQSVVDYLKIARNAIVLKHRIAADHELNEVLPTLRVRLESMAQKGSLPAISTTDLVQIAGVMEEVAG